MDYLKYAIEESKKSLSTNDVPIGAVIVKEGKIISKAHNQREKDNNILKHAEIIAILKANKKLKTWHLDDCIMYVTMEPCMMCTGVLIQSHIKKVVYCLSNEKVGFATSCNKLETEKVESREYEEILKNFFKKLRKNSN